MSQKPFFEAMMPTQLVELPFFESVSAGFPSPATDYMDKKLDLNELCIQNPSATFFIRVQGDSMQEAGIFEGDILIVDRSLRAKNRDIVVAVVEGDFVVKRYLSTRKEAVFNCRKPELSAYYHRRRDRFRDLGCCQKSDSPCLTATTHYIYSQAIRHYVEYPSVKANFLGLKLSI